MVVQLRAFDWFRAAGVSVWDGGPKNWRFEDGLHGVTWEFRLSMDRKTPFVSPTYTKWYSKFSNPLPAKSGTFRTEVLDFLF